MTPRSARAVLPSPAARLDLREAVLAWFADHGRELDFRVAGHRDPWGVLVSEVMAQQTQIGRVEERWPGFMAAFPTAEAMAASSPADVIRAWRGLGYNRRALNLHRAAVAIAAAGGTVPGDVGGLMALPGIGPYTARAVAAIGFGVPVGAVDVNVRRVLGRILAPAHAAGAAGGPGAGPGAGPIAEPVAIAPSVLQIAADALVDPDRPGTWTHALMDIGATICRPTRPSCASCPAEPWCRAARASGGRDRARPPGASPQVPCGTAHRAATKPTASRATARSGSAPVRFEQTTRWLRGRLVDRLRDAAPGEALAVEGPLGAHSSEAVARALAGLARDGMVELDAAGHARLAGSADPR